MRKSPPLPAAFSSRSKAEGRELKSNASLRYGDILLLKK
jgi:hypothetical protein